MIKNIIKKTTLKPSINRYLIELGPLLAVMAIVSCKLIYFNLILRDMWWTPEEPIGQWVRTHSHVFSATLASLFLLFAIVPLVSRIWRFMILLILNFLLTSLVWANIIYLNFHEDVISISSFLNATLVPVIRSSIFEILRPTHAIWYIDIFISVLALPFYVRTCRRIEPINRRVMLHFCIVLVIAGLLLSIPTLRLIKQDENGLLAYVTIRREIASTIGLLPYHFSEVLILPPWKKVEIGESELQRVRCFFEEERKKKGKNSALFGAARGKNLILICAESLQAFTIGLKVNGQSVTPSLSSFAKESLHFKNFYDQTYLGTTSDAEFISLQSLYPLPEGNVASKYNENYYYAFPEILTQHGYSTFSAVGETAEIWSMNKMHSLFGFQKSYFEDHYNVFERIGPWMTDRDFFNQTISLLEMQKKPFMIYLLSSSNHHPYPLPKKYLLLNLGKLEGTLLGNYLHSVHYFDQVFGEFLDQLRKVGLLNESVIALYGDHHGFLGEPSAIAKLVELPVQNEYHRLLLKKRLPFFVRLPNGESAGVSFVTGGHLDISPTLLNLLGINNENVLMLGKDLTQGENSLVVFRDGSFLDGVHFFINRFGPSSRSTCYEFTTGQTTNCKLLEGRHHEARERLEISDLIIQGNLIPYLKGYSPSNLGP